MPLPSGFPEIDFDAFHLRRLPEWLASGRAEPAARAAAHLGPLALRLTDGRAYTYLPRRSTIDILPGDTEADNVLELDLESWQGLVHDIEAPAGLLYSGRARCLRGTAIALMQWETPLRVLYHGRAPYDPARIDLRDRDGEPLDCERAFTLDDDRRDMAHFLASAGYLFVRGVFDAAEVALLRAGAAELRHEARKGDKLSWWAKNERGDEVLCRVTRAASKPHLAQLQRDARLHGLKDLAPGQWVNCRGEGDGVTVIYKQPGITQGLGDLPWHRDCGMGGHALRCPTLTASVFLFEGSPQTGELTFLPGSGSTAFNAHDPLCRGPLPAAHFHAQPGDVTLHYGDTVHAAPPPSPGCADYRVSAILDFGRPDTTHRRAEGSYNDALHRRDDGQIEHLNDLAEKL